MRIGLHTADANLRATDYSGRGVHVAARVCARADADEVLATTDTLAEAGATAVVGGARARDAEGHQRTDLARRDRLGRVRDAATQRGRGSILVLSRR